MVVSRNAPRQNSWPAVDGFRPPSAPAPMIWRRPLSSGFGAVRRVRVGDVEEVRPRRGRDRGRHRHRRRRRVAVVHGLEHRARGERVRVTGGPDVDRHAREQPPANERAVAVGGAFGGGVGQRDHGRRGLRAGGGDDPVTVRDDLTRHLVFRVLDRAFDLQVLAGDDRLHVGSGLRERRGVQRDLEPRVHERPERLRDRLLQRRVQVATAGTDRRVAAGAPAPDRGLGLLADHRALEALDPPERSVLVLELLLHPVGGPRFLERARH